MNCTVAALLRNPRSEEEAVEVDTRPRMGFSVRVLRCIAVVVAVLLCHLTVAPLAQAAMQSQDLARGVARTAVDEYGALLSRIQAAANAGQWPEVKSLAAKLETEKAKLEEEWAGLDAAWRAAGVSGEVINRQKAMEAALLSRHASLKALLSRVDDAAGQVALRNDLNGLATPSTASLVDLENLPWRVEKGKAREALEDGAALDAALKLETQAVSPAAAPVAAQARLLRGPAAPQASPELSPTLDAPQSAEIRALAAELGNNPYKIHQWVYDNIRFFPTYGSVQGAEETLAKKSGNAFDIASLLIALLRSAGIESRYVYGTVRIPSEQVMNWVGGVKTPEVAQQILGQGGIPNTGLASGGKIVTIRLEHVWVEAWIKFHPERGIDHAGGISEGDSWAPLDASFKQYTYTEGMDLQEAVPFDAEALINAARQGAEVNEAEGWVRNVNQAAVENRFKAYQQQLKTY